jgi:hypothetical protein
MVIDSRVRNPVIVNECFITVSSMLCSIYNNLLRLADVYHKNLLFESTLWIKDNEN